MFHPDTLEEGKLHDGAISYCIEHTSPCFRCGKSYPSDNEHVIMFKKADRRATMCKKCYEARQLLADILLLNKFPRDVIGYLLWNHTMKP